MICNISKFEVCYCHPEFDSLSDEYSFDVIITVETDNKQLTKWRCVTFSSDVMLVPAHSWNCASVVKTYIDVF